MEIAVRVERYKDDPASWTQDNVMNGDDMNDIVLDMDLGSPEEDALLSATLDAFITEQLARDIQEGPQMIVRTAFRPSGQMCKEIVFQNRKWADAFQLFWESQKLQAGAA
jgi:hypothetical protein